MTISVISEHLSPIDIPKHFGESLFQQVESLAFRSFWFLLFPVLFIAKCSIIEQTSQNNQLF